MIKTITRFIFLLLTLVFSEEIWIGLIQHMVGYIELQKGVTPKDLKSQLPIS